MPRQKSAVLKGKTSAAVKKADKVKELKAEIKSIEREIGKLDKEIGKLDVRHTKLTDKLAKLETPKQVEVVEVGNEVVLATAPTTDTESGAGVVVAQEERQDVQQAA